MTLKQKIFSALAALVLVLTAVGGVLPAYAASGTAIGPQNFL